MSPPKKPHLDAVLIFRMSLAAAVIGTVLGFAFKHTLDRHTWQVFLFGALVVMLCFYREMPGFLRGVVSGIAAWRKG